MKTKKQVEIRLEDEDVEVLDENFPEGDKRRGQAMLVHADAFIRGSRKGFSDGQNDAINNTIELLKTLGILKKNDNGLYCKIKKLVGENGTYF